MVLQRGQSLAKWARLGAGALVGQGAFTETRQPGREKRKMVVGDTESLLDQTLASLL